MPLHLTKVAYGCDGLPALEARLRQRIAQGFALRPTTRYLPKRHAEIVGGSLFWIIRHQLVARSTVTGFGTGDDGRVAIELAPELVLVEPRRKRAHQGWRYLDAADAPPDLGGGAEGLAAMPAELVGRLAALELI